MLKKYFKLFLSVLCVLFISIPCFTINTVNADTTSTTEKYNKNDDSEQDDISIGVILLVFTLACTGSAVITYKIRMNLNNSKKNINNDN